MRSKTDISGMAKSIVVLIGGGHAAGKRTTVSNLEAEIATVCGNSVSVEHIDLATYEDKSATASVFSNVSSAISISTNHGGPGLKPSRFNFVRLHEDLRALQETPDPNQCRVILIHGLYALYDPTLRDLAHIKVFIESDPDTRLIRMVRLDVSDKQMPLQDVLHAYLHSYRAEMSNFIVPTKEFADVIMPRGAEPQSAQLILDGIAPYINGSGVSLDACVPEMRLRPIMIDLTGFERQSSKFYELG